MGEVGNGPTSVDAAVTTMIERLRADGVLSSSTVEEALRSVQRHLFIDGATLDAAYAEAAVTVKVDDDGTALSSVSQPAIVAGMLELMQLGPGHRVLEVGAGAGYNAALLSHIVGSGGLVVTIEIEKDLAIAARSRLAASGFDDVQVVAGDGVDGFPEAAPYDRVIVTTGAMMVAPTWVDQLAEGGRLVTPVVDAAGIGKIHCYVKDESGLEEVETRPCGFLPMRGRA